MACSSFHSQKTYAGKLYELQASKALGLKEENTIFSRGIRDVLLFLTKDYVAVLAQKSALTLF